jgi:hypothetical protein
MCGNKVAGVKDLCMRVEPTFSELVFLHQGQDAPLECHLSLRPAAVDDALHDVAAVEHELAERIWLLALALFDSRKVLLQIDHFARPTTTRRSLA